MTEQQRDMIKTMSNADLVDYYKTFILMNEREGNIILGVKVELEVAIKQEILNRLAK